MLESIVASVVLPAIIDFVKGAAPAIGRKWFGVSVEDQIKLDNAGIERTKALAALDNPYGVPSQWVIDLRASFRYIAAPAVMIVGAMVLYQGATVEDGQNLVDLGGQLVGMPFGFIFGERLYLGLKGGPK
jgi:hypothetical protein